MSGAALVEIASTRTSLLYPESGKVGVFERLPEGGGLYALFRDRDAVDYWEGETAPAG